MGKVLGLVLVPRIHLFVCQSYAASSARQQASQKNVQTSLVNLYVRGGESVQFRARFIRRCPAVGLI